MGRLGLLGGLIAAAIGVLGWRFLRVVRMPDDGSRRADSGRRRAGMGGVSGGVSEPRSSGRPLRAEHARVAGAAAGGLALLPTHRGGHRRRAALGPRHPVRLQAGPRGRPLPAGAGRASGRRRAGADGARRGGIGRGRRLPRHARRPRRGGRPDRDPRRGPAAALRHGGRPAHPMDRATALVGSTTASCTSSTGASAGWAAPASRTTSRTAASTTCSCGSPGRSSRQQQASFLASFAELGAPLPDDLWPVLPGGRLTPARSTPPS